MRMTPVSSSLLLLFLLLPPVARALTDPASAEWKAAMELFAARQDGDAQVAFEAMIKADPNDHRALYQLGRLAKRKNDWARVTQCYERCTQLAPNEATYWSDLGEAYGKLAKRAGIFEQLSLAGKCRAALEKAVDLEPDNLELRMGLIDFYKQAPGIAGGSTSKALAQAAEIKKRDAYAGAMATGNLYLYDKDWANAEQAFKEAARLKPENLDPPFALGQMFTARGRYAEAFDVFEDLVTKNPGNFGALYQIGRAAALSGQRLERGEAVLRTYLSQPQRASNLPTHAQALFRLGEILAKKGDIAGARASFEESLKKDPGFKDAAEALKRL